MTVELLKERVKLIAGHPGQVAKPASARASYDVIVIGAGLGGLTAAAYLARSGQKVLICDRNPQPGGLATTIYQQGFALSHCPFLLWGAYEGGWTLEMFEELGLRQAVPLLTVDPLSRVVFPESTFEIPADPEVFQEILCCQFPGEAYGIVSLFDELEQLVDEWHRLAPDLSCLPPASRLASLQGLTFDEYLDRFISRDRQLRALLSSSWAHWGLPPSRVSGLLAALLLSFGHRGMRTLKGGPSPLSNALAEVIVSHGGELRLNTSVTRILIKQGRAYGIELPDGSQLEAPVIISNAPATHTFLDLVGSEWLSRTFVNKLKQLQPSMSAFQIYLGTDLDLTTIPNLAVETTFLSDYDQEEVFQKAIQGEFEASFTLFSYSLLDPSAAPNGQHCLKLLGAGPYRRRWLDWERDKTAIADRLIKAAEKIIPGLSEHICWQKISTPLDLEQITNAPGAAIYGWSASPEQIGPDRLNRVTPIEGLYLAGAWTGPFAGMDLCMLSGRETARLLIQNRVEAGITAG